MLEFLEFYSNIFKYVQTFLQGGHLTMVFLIYFQRHLQGDIFFHLRIFLVQLLKKLKIIIFWYDEN